MNQTQPSKRDWEQWESQTPFGWVNDCTGDATDHYPDCQGCERIVILNRKEYDDLISHIREEAVSEADEIIKMLVLQFGTYTNEKGKEVLSDMALSALEDAFDYLKIKNNQSISALKPKEDL